MQIVLVLLFLKGYILLSRLNIGTFLKDLPPPPTPPPTPPPGSILKPLKGSQCAQTHTVLYKPIHAKHNFFPSWLMP